MDGKDPSTAEMIAFTNETNACDFSLRDAKGKDNFALINKTSMAYQSLDQNLATRQALQSAILVHGAENDLTGYVIRSNHSQRQSIAFINTVF